MLTREWVLEGQKGDRKLQNRDSKEGNSRSEQKRGKGRDGESRLTIMEGKMGEREP